MTVLKRSEIRIRDPFILTDTEHGCYYMYGTTALVCGSISAKRSFSVYKTYDLETFEEGKIIFDADKTDFWADRDFWAPEVHRYNGKYYLFGSCKAEDKCRGTHIFVCDTPDGTFVPLTAEPITPADWECLDGTLYIEDGVPYIVFCHEWLQVKDGEIWAQQLSTDLTEKIGEPFMLFKASDAKDVTEIDKKGSGNYVTDGPFFYRENGTLKMIWSSFTNGRYVVLSAESSSIRSEWKHNGSQFDFDGGHAMIFETLNGERMISLHAPNVTNFERPLFIKF